MSPQPGPGEKITSVSGRGIPLRGNDIDTDRIMPARFLKVVSFEGLEHHLFEDDRKTNREQHPFGDMRYNEATVLVVNANFGCGSSREHAPQGLVRYGIRAIIGESFSEIFLGNSAVLGLPCFTADHASIEKLQALVEQTPEVTISANVETGVIAAGPLDVRPRRCRRPCAMRSSAANGIPRPCCWLISAPCARSRNDCRTSRDSELSGVVQAFGPAGLYVSSASRRRRHNRQETFASRASTRLAKIPFNNGERNRRPVSYWLTVPLVALRSATGS